MTTITAKVIADSVNPDGNRLTTLECRYPRFIHAQLLTHRQFSRNAQSSRACPVEKMIEEVEKDPVMPIHWGKNQRGMQAKEECNEWVCTEGYWPMPREDAWKMARDSALEIAREFAEAGYHKQIINRLLEPFAHITTIITATEWDNFFKLRLHEDSQPEIQRLAQVMKEAMDESDPAYAMWGGLHLPYDQNSVVYSVACCARVSYNNHDGTDRDPEKDRKLHDFLKENGHWSPFEHQAIATQGDFANFKGWESYRHMNDHF